jgi:hypothetical protein
MLATPQVFRAAMWQAQQTKTPRPLEVEVDKANALKYDTS